MRKYISISILVLVLVCSALLALTGYAAEKIISYNFNVGHSYTASSVPNQICVDFGKMLSERTDGRLTLTIFTDAQMGGDEVMFEALQMKSMDILVGGMGIVSSVAPQCNILGVPYVLRDWDHVVAVLEGEPGRIMAEAVENNSNIKFIGFSKRGARQLTANKEIRTPGDMAGFVLRVPANPQYLIFWEKICTASPLAWGEIYTALQQGLFDGQENPIDQIYDYNLNEVQKYLILTSHLNIPYFYWINKNSLYDLSQEDQALFMNTLKEAISKGNQEVDAVNEDKLEKLKKKGMIVIEPDVEAFIEVAKQAHQEEINNGEADPDFYQLIMSVGSN